MRRMVICWPSTQPLAAQSATSNYKVPIRRGPPTRIGLNLPSHLTGVLSSAVKGRGWGAGWRSSLASSGAAVGDEEKLRILAELDEPGAKFNDVARRHDVSRGLLWQWRDAQRRGKLVAETTGFGRCVLCRNCPRRSRRAGAGGAYRP